MSCSCPACIGLHMGYGNGHLLGACRFGPLLTEQGRHPCPSMHLMQTSQYYGLLLRAWCKKMFVELLIVQQALHNLRGMPCYAMLSLHGHPACPLIPMPDLPGFGKLSSGPFSSCPKAQAFPECYRHFLAENASQCNNMQGHCLRRA